MAPCRSGISGHASCRVGVEAARGDIDGAMAPAPVRRAFSASLDRVRETAARAVVDPGGRATQIGRPRAPRPVASAPWRGKPPGAELVMHDVVQHAIELRLVGRAIHHREIVGVEPVLLLPELGADALVRTACPAADTTPTRRCRPGRASRTSCSVASMSSHAFAGIAELQEQADLDAGRLQARRAAVRICSTRMPFSIASRMRCDPDSAPIHTMRQPGGGERADDVGDRPDRRASGSGTACARRCSLDQRRERARPIPAAGQTHRPRSTS